MIAYYVFIVTLWYLYGHCFLTTIEKYLENDNSKPKQSFISKMFIDVFGPSSEIVIYYILSLIPLFNTIVCLIKINNIKLML